MSSERFVLPAVKPCFTGKSPRIPVRMNRATTIKPLKSFNGDHLGKLVKVESKEYNSQVRGLNASIEQQLKYRLYKMFQGQQIMIDKAEREQASNYTRLVHLHNEKRRMMRERNELRRQQIRRDYEYLMRQKEVDAEMSSLENKLDSISQDIARLENNENKAPETTEQPAPKEATSKDTVPDSSDHIGGGDSQQLDSQITNQPQRRTMQEVKVLQAGRDRNRPTVERRTSNLDDESINRSKVENHQITQSSEMETKQSEEPKCVQTSFEGYLSAKEPSFIITPTPRPQNVHADDSKKFTPLISPQMVKELQTDKEKPLSKVEELKLWRKKRRDIDQKKLLEEPFNIYACDREGNLLKLEDPVVLKDTEKTKEPTNRKFYEIHRQVDHSRRDYLHRIHDIEEFIQTNYKTKAQQSVHPSKNVFSRRPLTEREIMKLPKSINPESDEARQFLQYLPKYGPNLAKEMVFLTFDDK